MKLIELLLALQGLPIVLSLIAFAWKRRKHRGKRRGFYPTTFALGIALQQLQLLTAPSLEYTIAEKLTQQAEEDDEGGPDTAAQHLDRQLRRIRRGERLDTLTALLPDRD